MTGWPTLLLGCSATSRRTAIIPPAPQPVSSTLIAATHPLRTCSLQLSGLFDTQTRVRACRGGTAHRQGSAAAR
ncbi:hypothetical protein B0H19DRAFT_1185174 [Mycena capillaripes]|nr:hypothetical protein B0H19DRAFT_1185174 [Mycena capillaripes]